MARKHQRQKSAWPYSAIFTVGHSTLPLDTFIALLHSYDIECLADIRTVPRSRHNPQFNTDVLSGGSRKGSLPNSLELSLLHNRRFAAASSA